MCPRALYSPIAGERDVSTETANYKGGVCTEYIGVSSRHSFPRNLGARIVNRSAGLNTGPLFSREWTFGQAHSTALGTTTEYLQAVNNHSTRHPAAWLILHDTLLHLVRSYMAECSDWLSSERLADQVCSLCGTDITIGPSSRKEATADGNVRRELSPIPDRTPLLLRTT